jgi:hypothetical protein
VSEIAANPFTFTIIGIAVIVAVRDEKSKGPAPPIMFAASALVKSSFNALILARDKP